MTDAWRFTLGALAGNQLTTWAFLLTVRPAPGAWSLIGAIACGLVGTLGGGAAVSRRSP